MNNSCYLLCRQKSYYGGLILNFAREYGLKIDGVILQEWGKKQKINRFKYYAKKYGFIRVLFFSLVELFDAKFLMPKNFIQSSPEDGINALGLNSYVIPSLNGQETIDLLNVLTPSILLLGGVGIISNNIIRMVQKIVINSHPGILPNYRGNYVIRWAILAKDPIFITVHQVDQGIDTGKILWMEPVQITPSRSLRNIERETEVLRAKYLIQVTQDYINGKIELKNQDETFDNPKVYSLPDAVNLIKMYSNNWKS